MNRTPKENRIIAIFWMLVGVAGILFPLLTRNFTTGGIALIGLSVAVICLNWIRFDRNR